MELWKRRLLYRNYEWGRHIGEEERRIKRREKIMRKKDKKMKEMGKGRNKIRSKMHNGQDNKNVNKMVLEKGDKIRREGTGMS